MLVKKLISTVCMLVLAASALVGCVQTNTQNTSSSPEEQENAPAKTDQSRLRLLTGGAQGVYYGFGSAIAEHAASNANLNIDVLISSGSKATIESLVDGLADFGFCQSDVMVSAFNGTLSFESNPLRGFSVLAELYPEYVQIVTTNPEIKTVADLAGKTVSLGAPDSGVYFTSLQILAAYGISERDITPTFQGFGDSVESLKDEQIDAAFFVAGAPTPAITDLAASVPIYLLSLDQEHIDTLAASNSAYKPAIIAAHTYNGVAEDVATVSLQAVLLASNSVSEDDAYALVKDMFSAAADEKAAASHAKYGDLNLVEAQKITAIPYHSGATRYFKEQK